MRFLRLGIFIHIKSFATFAPKKHPGNWVRYLFPPTVRFPESLLNDINVLSKHHLGFSHTYFLPEFGCPVESEVERKTIEFNGVEYPDITWKCGFIVNDELFEKIQNGEINSFSFGGFGCREVLFEVDSN